MIVGEIVGIVAFPFELVDRVGQRHPMRDFNDRLGFDAQLLMGTQNVEMIDRVSEVVGVGVKLCARIGVELERAQRLGAFRTRLHAQLHHALAHGGRIAKARDMADRKEHQRPSS